MEHFLVVLSQEVWLNEIQAHFQAILPLCLLKNLPFKTQERKPLDFI